MDNQAQILDLARLQQLAEAAKASGCELREILGDTSAMYTPQGSLIEFCEAATPAVVLMLAAEIERLQKLVSWQGEGNTKITVNAGPVMKLMDERDQLKAENETLRKAAAGAIKYVAFAFDQGIEGAEAAGIALENAAARAARL